MKRKYLSEFGIHAFTSYKTVIPVERLETWKDSHKYHIYSIISCDKAVIDYESIVQSKDGISCKIEVLKDKKSETFEIQNFKFHNNLDHTKIDIKSDYPFYDVKFTIRDFDFIKEKFGRTDQVTYEMDVPYFLNISSPEKQSEFEIQYIGQSFGKEGERDALKRLSSHSTLQKILTDFHTKRPNQRLYVFLMEFTPQLLMTFDGRNKDYMTTIEEDDKHVRAVISSPHKFSQFINVTEAALINYFKPEYNINFIDNFPNKNHKGYKQYYDLDFNSILVEIDNEFDEGNIILYTGANKLSSPFQTIKYRIFNNNHRKSMFDMFK